MVPIFKEKIWGGRNLKKILNKKIPKNKYVGEDWEAADFGTNQSKIANGYLKGKSLNFACRLWGKRLFGKNYRGRFPLFIKFIDARQPLSVQVHPDNYYCKKKDPSNTGKKETWIVLHSDKDSRILCGVKKRLSKIQFSNAVKKNVIEKFLKSYKVKKGDCIQINPGTIHSLKAGVLVLEIQQASDTTYRIYDYGRTDGNGTLRQLHLDKAIDVVDLNPKNCLIKPRIIHRDRFFTEELIADEKEYRIERLVVLNRVQRKLNKRSFQIVCVISGKASLMCNGNAYRLFKGDVWIIPAEISKFEIQNLKPKRTSEIILVEGGRIV
jgi:mannose-6-phosphate isomerase